ncbi:hypothetical protein CBR_g48642 [Chara braunii]|uniref:TF-B3 domain-containing protein n=1 Tax=Chara braunii TaxID=69332 RepID=A0A388M388_CHABU|nr:hypothetical protein CBR_g48642 [Chara braunii]|eukprot:GBG89034.1 hypothetical protein CBR_g48642 [Chara braunii]
MDHSTSNCELGKTAGEDGGAVACLGQGKSSEWYPVEDLSTDQMMVVDSRTEARSARGQIVRSDDFYHDEGAACSRRVKGDAEAAAMEGNTDCLGNGSEQIAHGGDNACTFAGTPSNSLNAPEIAHDNSGCSGTGSSGGKEGANGDIGMGGHDKHAEVISWDENVGSGKPVANTDTRFSEDADGRCEVEADIGAKDALCTNGGNVSADVDIGIISKPCVMESGAVRMSSGDPDDGPKARVMCPSGMTSYGDSAHEQGPCGDRNAAFRFAADLVKGDVATENVVPVVSASDDVAVMSASGGDLAGAPDVNDPDRTMESLVVKVAGEGSDGKEGDSRATEAASVKIHVAVGKRNGLSVIGQSEDVDTTSVSDGDVCRASNISGADCCSIESLVVRGSFDQGQGKLADCSTGIIGVNGDGTGDLSDGGEGSGSRDGTSSGKVDLAGISGNGRSLTGDTVASEERAALSGCVRLAELVSDGDGSADNDRSLNDVSHDHFTADSSAPASDMAVCGNEPSGKQEDAAADGVVGIASGGASMVISKDDRFGQMKDPGLDVAGADAAEDGESVREQISSEAPGSSKVTHASKSEQMSDGAAVENSYVEVLEPYEPGQNDRAGSSRNCAVVPPDNGGDDDSGGKHSRLELTVAIPEDPPVDGDRFATAPDQYIERRADVRDHVCGVDSSSGTPVVATNRVSSEDETGILFNHNRADRSSNDGGAGAGAGGLEHFNSHRTAVVDGYMMDTSNVNNICAGLGGETEIISGMEPKQVSPWNGGCSVDADGASLSQVTSGNTCNRDVENEKSLGAEVDKGCTVLHVPHVDGISNSAPCFDVIVQDRFAVTHDGNVVASDGGAPNDHHKCVRVEHTDSGNCDAALGINGEIGLEKSGIRRACLMGSEQGLAVNSAGSVGGSCQSFCGCEVVQGASSYTASCNPEAGSGTDNDRGAGLDGMATSLTKYFDASGDGEGQPPQIHGHDSSNINVSCNQERYGRDDAGWCSVVSKAQNFCHAGANGDGREASFSADATVGAGGEPMNGGAAVNSAAEGGQYNDGEGSDGNTGGPAPLACITRESDAGVMKRPLLDGDGVMRCSAKTGAEDAGGSAVNGPALMGSLSDRREGIPLSGQVTACRNASAAVSTSHSCDLQLVNCQTHVAAGKNGKNADEGTRFDGSGGAANRADDCRNAGLDAGSVPHRLAEFHEGKDVSMPDIMSLVSDVHAMDSQDDTLAGEDQTNFLNNSHPGRSFAMDMDVCEVTPKQHDDADCERADGAVKSAKGALVKPVLEGQEIGASQGLGNCDVGNLNSDDLIRVHDERCILAAANESVVDGQLGDGCEGSSVNDRFIACGMECVDGGLGCHERGRDGDASQCCGNGLTADKDRPFKDTKTSPEDRSTREIAQTAGSGVGVSVLHVTVPDLATGDCSVEMIVGGGGLKDVPKGLSVGEQSSAHCIREDAVGKEEVGVQEGCSPGGLEGPDRAKFLSMCSKAVSTLGCQAGDLCTEPMHLGNGGDTSAPYAADAVLHEEESPEDQTERGQMCSAGRDTCGFGMHAPGASNVNCNCVREGSGPITDTVNSVAGTINSGGRHLVDPIAVDGGGEACVHAVSDVERHDAVACLDDGNARSSADDGTILGLTSEHAYNPAISCRGGQGSATSSLCACDSQARKHESPCSQKCSPPGRTPGAVKNAGNGVEQSSGLGGERDGSLGDDLLFADLVTSRGEEAQRERDGDVSMAPVCDRSNGICSVVKDDKAFKELSLGSNACILVDSPLHHGLRTTPSKNSEQNGAVDVQSAELSKTESRHPLSLKFDGAVKEPLVLGVGHATILENKYGSSPLTECERKDDLCHGQRLESSRSSRAAMKVDKPVEYSVLQGGGCGDVPYKCALLDDHVTPGSSCPDGERESDADVRLDHVCKESHSLEPTIEQDDNVKEPSLGAGDDLSWRSSAKDAKAKGLVDVHQGCEERSNLVSIVEVEKNVVEPALIADEVLADDPPENVQEDVQGKCGVAVVPTQEYDRILVPPQVEVANKYAEVPSLRAGDHVAILREDPMFNNNGTGSSRIEGKCAQHVLCGCEQTSVLGPDEYNDVDTEFFAQVKGRFIIPLGHDGVLGDSSTPSLRSCGFPRTHKHENSCGTVEHEGGGSLRHNKEAEGPMTTVVGNNDDSGDVSGVKHAHCPASVTTTGIVVKVNMGGGDGGASANCSVIPDAMCGLDVQPVQRQQSGGGSSCEGAAKNDKAKDSACDARVSSELDDVVKESGISILGLQGTAYGKGNECPRPGVEATSNDERHALVGEGKSGKMSNWNDAQGPGASCCNALSGSDSGLGKHLPGNSAGGICVQRSKGKGVHVFLSVKDKSTIAGAQKHELGHTASCSQDASPRVVSIAPSFSVRLCPSLKDSTVVVNPRHGSNTFAHTMENDDRSSRGQDGNGVGVGADGDDVPRLGRDDHHIDDMGEHRAIVYPIGRDLHRFENKGCNSESAKAEQHEVKQQLTCPVDDLKRALSVPYKFHLRLYASTKEAQAAAAHCVRSLEGYRPAIWKQIGKNRRSKSPGAVALHSMPIFRSWFQKSVLGHIEKGHVELDVVVEDWEGNRWAMTWHHRKSMLLNGWANLMSYHSLAFGDFIVFEAVGPSLLKIFAFCVGDGEDGYGEIEEQEGDGGYWRGKRLLEARKRRRQAKRRKGGVVPLPNQQSPDSGLHRSSVINPDYGHDHLNGRNEGESGGHAIRLLSNKGIFPCKRERGARASQVLETQISTQDDLVDEQTERRRSNRRKRVKRIVAALFQKKMRVEKEREESKEAAMKRKDTKCSDQYVTLRRQTLLEERKNVMERVEAFDSEYPTFACKMTPSVLRNWLGEEGSTDDDRRDVRLQWIYVKGLAFNAFRGLEFQRVRRAAKRVPRTGQLRFPLYRVTVGIGIPSQRGKVASMVSEVRSAFRHTGATILSDWRKSHSGKLLVNFLAGGANNALLYATVARDGSVRDTADIVYRRWRAIILSFPAKDMIGFCTDSTSNYTAATRRFATDEDPSIRRITWLPCSTHVCNLMLSDIGTRVGWVKDTIIRARVLVRFIKSHGAAHALFRKVSPRVQLVEPVVTLFASVFLMLTCLDGRRDALESMLHGDAWACIPWERRLVAQAQWVQQLICDGEFWRCVDYAIRVMAPVHQLLRRMDRRGMMMSIVYEWSQNVLQLMRSVDVPMDMIEPCVREVAIRNLHMLEPAHATAHLLNPRRRSLRYYESLQTTSDDARVVEECDKFLLAQTGGDPVSRLYRTVRDQMRHFHSRRGDWGDRQLSDAEADDCRGDSETERCAAWWFAHGRHHPELRTIAIRVMHLWTSASPAERNWAQHKRINTARRCKLGFAKLAELVEIATNLKLAARAQQGGGFVLPWVLGTGREETAGEEEDDEADVEPEVWGARPVGSVREQEIQRQVVAFHDSRPSRARAVQDVFGQRATELRPWPEAVDDGPDGRAGVLHLRGDGRRGRRPSAADMLEQEPQGGLQTTGRRWEVRSDIEHEREAEEEEVPRQDRRYSPSHHRTTAPPEALRRSERLASTAGRERTHDSEEREGERTPSGSGIRPRSPSELRTDDFDVGHTGGGLGDFSAPGRRHASSSEVHTDDFDLRGRVETEERDARLDREEERLRTLPGWEAEVAAGQAALDAIQRQRDTVAAQAAEDEDADTEFEPLESVVRRCRAAVAAAAAAAQAAYISGAEGTGAEGRGGRSGGQHG